MKLINITQYLNEGYNYTVTRTPLNKVRKKRFSKLAFLNYEQRKKKH